MPFVKCSVDGCSRKLQPVLKPDPRDRETWVYPECEVCFRPCCQKHSSDTGGRIVCDRCRREFEAGRPPAEVVNLGTERLPWPR